MKTNWHWTFSSADLSQATDDIIAKAFGSVESMNIHTHYEEGLAYVTAPFVHSICCVSVGHRMTICASVFAC